MNTIEKISVSQLKNIGLEMSVLDDDIILSNNIEIKNKIFDTPCRLDGFVLLFCTNGEAEIQINFQEYKIHPGILVMNIPENVIYISNVNNLKVYPIVISSDFLKKMNIKMKDLMKLYVFAKKIPLVSLEYSEIMTLEKYYFLLEDIILSNEEHKKAVLEGLVQSLISKLNSIIHRFQNNIPDSQSKKRNEEIFEAFIELLTRNEATERNLAYSELVDRLLNAKSSNESGKIIFNKQIPKENSPLVNFMLMWIVPGVLFYLLWWGTSSLMKKRMGGAPGNVMSFGNSGAKIYADSEVKTTFADVAGQEEAKEGLNEIVDFLHNPSKYASIGAKLPKGALLVGPPGTGKTLIARAVAGEAKVPFFAISGSNFVQMFVGMGAAKVRDLFMQAKEKAPCIIFIDEIDAIGKKRNTGPMGGNDECEQTLNQLLTEMDGFDGKKGVVILAATNRPESLDSALLRPGRFDRTVIMNLPDLEGRKAILNVHLKNIKHKDIDVDLIARATAGSSGDELANIVNEAALLAVRTGKEYVSTSDLEESVETVIAGAQKKGMVISEKEKKIIAYHEIGHALVAAMQTHSAPVHKITIIPRTSGALGYTMQVDSKEKYLLSKEELLNKITTFTGGRASEKVIFDVITTGASNDIEQATRIARSMVSRYGMSDKYGMMALETVNNAYLGGDTTLACSSATAADIDSEVRAIIENAYNKAVEIIKANRKKMDELAGFLLEKETITGEEFMEILNR